MSIEASLALRVEALERQLAALLKERGAARREAIPVVAQQVRLARTCNDGSAYPTRPADTFAVKFLDGTFTENDGDQTPTYTNRSASFQKYAHNVREGEFIPDDTVVVVAEFNGKWWIIQTVGLPGTLMRFELTAALTAGGSAAGKKVIWNGSAYVVTGSSITFRDFLGVFTGASGDQGWAVQMDDRTEPEIVFIESVTTESGKVRLESGGTLDFFKLLLNNFNTSATYTSGRDLLVEFEIVSGKLTAYVRTPGISGHATTGEKVLTISTNVSTYVGPSEECS